MIGKLFLKKWYPFEEPNTRLQGKVGRCKTEEATLSIGTYNVLKLHTVHSKINFNYHHMIMYSTLCMITLM